MSSGAAVSGHPLVCWWLPLLEGSPALACGCGLMDVSFLALQTFLEFLPLLQLFTGISGQHPSPMVFLLRVFSCVPTSNTVLSTQTAGGLLVSPRVLGHQFSLFAGTLVTWVPLSPLEADREAVWGPGLSPEFLT